LAALCPHPVRQRPGTSILHATGNRGDKRPKGARFLVSCIFHARLFLALSIDAVRTLICNPAEGLGVSCISHPVPGCACKSASRTTLLAPSAPTSSLQLYCLCSLVMPCSWSEATTTPSGCPVAWGIRTSTTLTPNSTCMVPTILHSYSCTAFAIHLSLSRVNCLDRHYLHELLEGIQSGEQLIFRAACRS
jgi:hypothetical protein